MKKIILLCLTAISFCQAADPEAFGKVDMSQMVDMIWNQVAGEKDWRKAKSIRLDGKDGRRVTLALNDISIELDDGNSKTIRDISGDLFRSQFPNLESLDVRGISISALPDNFNPPQLQTLDLRDNQINDDVINQMIERFNTHPDYLPSLEYLDLSGNPITQGAAERLRTVLRKQNRNIELRTIGLTGD